MKLAIISLEFAPKIGGVETYLLEMAKRISTTNRVIVITAEDQPIPLKMPFQQIFTPTASWFGFWNALRACKPDRVMVGHGHPRLLLAAFLFRSDRYATVTYGNDYLAAQKRWHRPMFNWLLKRSRPLITISRANAARLQALGLPGARIVYPGTDPGQFSPPAKAPGPPPRLLTVGRLVPRKGIDTVIRALPLLIPGLPELAYDIVGDGPDRARLKALVSDLGLEETVNFHGAVSQSELTDFYRRAHIFVMPARHEIEASSMEGFGIVYLEASASGLPVVAGRAGGAVEAVRDGETGLLVPPDNPEALAQTLGKLLADDDLRQKFGGAGRRWVEAEMNWDRSAQRLARMLDLDEPAH